MTGMPDGRKRAATYRMDEELIAALEEVRVRDGIAISEQIRRAVRAWLETKGIRIKTPEEMKRAAKRRSRKE
jgi:hypothetical protein